MEGKKILQVLIIGGLSVLAGLIIFYYWTHNDFSSLAYVPMYVMIFTLGYILLQIVRRFISKEQNWWDWLYYIGLISMMLGIFFSKPETANLFNRITDIGVFSLLLPLFFDLTKLLKKQN